jgi:hypothetical protein
MNKSKLNLIKVMVLAAMVAMTISSCNEDDISVDDVQQEKAQLNYELQYSDQQLKNWKETGSPFLEDEQLNSSNTRIEEHIPSQGGVFEPIPVVSTKAFGPHPYQNRYWSMVRLKLAIPVTSTPNALLKSRVVQVISEIQANTNVRFYNSINDPVTDPTYGFTYPNVHIHVSSDAKKGSSFVGLQGGEQYIYLPIEATKEFIMRALVNAAGMYNEQQRNDRDSYVNIFTANVAPENRFQFDKITTNFYSRGSFDFSSITLAGSTEFSNNGLNSITKKDNSTIAPNTALSSLDRGFLNYFYLPYIARTDTYRELANVVYDGNNVQLTETQRLDLQAYLNNGNPYPPTGGRITPVPW